MNWHAHLLKDYDTFVHMTLIQGLVTWLQWEWKQAACYTRMVKIMAADDLEKLLA